MYTRPFNAEARGYIMIMSSRKCSTTKRSPADAIHVVTTLSEYGRRFKQLLEVLSVPEKPLLVEQYAQLSSNGFYDNGTECSQLDENLLDRSYVNHHHSRGFTGGRLLSVWWTARDGLTSSSRYRAFLSPARCV